MILMIFCIFMWSGWSRAPQKHQYSYRNINVFSTGPPGTLQVAQELIFPRIMLESLKFSIIWRNSRNSMQLMDFYWIPVILARPGLAWPGQARPIQYTVYCTVYSIQYSVLYTVQYTVYCTVYSILYSIQYTAQYTVYCTVYCVLYSILCSILYTVQYVQYTVYCTVYYRVYSIL